jgi:hypothetical protein
MFGGAPYLNDVWRFSYGCSFGGYLNESGQCIACPKGRISETLNSLECSNCSQEHLLILMEVRFVLFVLLVYLMNTKDYLIV